MKEVLDSIQPVIKNSKHVHINEEAILEFSKGVISQDLEGSEFNAETVIKGATEEDWYEGDSCSS